MSEKQSKWVRIGLIIGVLALVIGGVLYWRTAGRESTDDAFIDAHIIPIR